VPYARFNPKVGDLVYFRWEDHCSYRGCEWETIKDIPARMSGSFCETTGFVIEVTRDHITTVAHVTVNYDGDEDGSQIATRLRRAIVHGKIIKRFK
jgi:hypothetical protein